MSSNEAKGYAAYESKGAMKPFTFQLPLVRDDDVKIEVTHCGICHSDIHQIDDDWSGSKFPICPGHEIVGKVVEVGKNVTKFKVGDRAAIGCYIGSCRECSNCKEGSGQYCEKGFLATYNGTRPDGSVTYGGYANKIVADHRYVNWVPDNLPSAETAPLMCAGITVYSPMKHWGLKKGDRLGVIGLGGLGHMAVKFGVAMGADVTVLSTSPKKEKEAKEVLGAHNFVVWTNPEALKQYSNHFDFIISTVAGGKLDINTLSGLMRANGKIVFVGVSTEAHSFSLLPLIFKRVTLAGSLIGGVDEVQEMLDFCSKHNITPIIEKLPIDTADQAVDRVRKGDNVRYRLVLEH